MNKIAVAKELVKIAKMLSVLGADDKIDRRDIDDLVKTTGKKMGLRDWGHMERTKEVRKAVKLFEDAVGKAVKTWVLANSEAFRDEGKYVIGDIFYGSAKENILTLLLGYNDGAVDALWGSKFIGDRGTWGKKMRRYLEEQLSGYVDNVEDALIDAVRMTGVGIAASEELVKTAKSLVSIDVPSQQEVKVYMYKPQGDFLFERKSDGLYLTLYDAHDEHTVFTWGFEEHFDIRKVGGVMSNKYRITRK